MKKLLTAILFLTSLQATQEAIITPLKSCNMIVDIKFFTSHNRLDFAKEPFIVNRVIYTERDRLNGYNPNEDYVYFLETIPPRGKMVLTYFFISRDGKVTKRKESITKENYHQKFPSTHIIPSSCNKLGFIRLEKFKQKSLEYGSKGVEFIKEKYKKIKNHLE